ncbi:MAG: hypothetical protein HY391_03930 [Deltaproteobacteria bacterium]|nr:hypothetical protein [Deltaproteobacteria bacterium]
MRRVSFEKPTFSPFSVSFFLLLTLQMSALTLADDETAQGKSASALINSFYTREKPDSQTIENLVSLGRSGNQQVIGEMVKIVASDLPSANRKQLALHILGNIGQRDGVIDPLSQRLKSAALPSQERVAILQTLGTLGGPQASAAAREQLNRALRDGDDFEKIVAPPLARAYRQHQNKYGEWVDDSDPDVHERVVRAQTTRKEFTERTNAAIEALGKTGEKSAATALFGLINEEKKRIQTQTPGVVQSHHLGEAAISLGNMSSQMDPQTQDHILTELRNLWSGLEFPYDRPEIKEKIAHALLATGSPEALSFLKEEVAKLNWRGEQQRQKEALADLINRQENLVAQSEIPTPGAVETDACQKWLENWRRESTALKRLFDLADWVRSTPSLLPQVPDQQIDGPYDTYFTSDGILVKPRLSNSPKK